MIKRTPLFHTYKPVVKKENLPWLGNPDKKKILLEVEEYILKDFDKICKEQHISRSEGIRKLLAAVTQNGELMDMGDVK